MTLATTRYAGCNDSHLTELNLIGRLSGDVTQGLRYPLIYGAASGSLVTLCGAVQSEFG